VVGGREEVGTADGALLELVEFALDEADDEGRFAHARFSQEHELVMPNSVHPSLLLLSSLLALT
jgi:hypothetical protein